MRYRLECPANRYDFKSRLNCSESTAGSLRQSGSEFQTVGPATEKARVPKVTGVHKCREISEILGDHWAICYCDDYNDYWNMCKML